jgi:hypothetical protein
VFFEYHPYWFFIKDRATRNTILEGRCVVGMTKPSVELWHSRLGHPSFNIVDYVLKNNELPFVQEASSGSVCDA